MRYVFQNKAFFLILRLFPPLVFSLFFSFEGKAKLHVEPYAGFSLSWTTGKKSGPDVTTASGITALINGPYYAGPNMGMRIGYSSLGFAVGGDFALGRWMAVGTNRKESLTPFLPGLFVSYKLPMLFKLYAVGIPYASAQAVSGEHKKTCLTQGVKLGGSYISLPFLSINLEYMPLHFGGKSCNIWSHTGVIYANFTF